MVRRVSIDLPCMIKKLGLLMFNWTDWKVSCNFCSVHLCPFNRYLETPPTAIYRHRTLHHNKRTIRKAARGNDQTCLAGHRDLLASFESDRTPRLVRVVEYDGHRGLRYSCLPSARQITRAGIISHYHAEESQQPDKYRL